jgi:hypothetical protein
MEEQKKVSDFPVDGGAPRRVLMTIKDARGVQHSFIFHVNVCVPLGRNLLEIMGAIPVAVPNGPKN